MIHCDMEMDLVQKSYNFWISAGFEVESTSGQFIELKYVFDNANVDSLMRRIQKYATFADSKYIKVTKLVVTGGGPYFARFIERLILHIIVFSDLRELIIDGLYELESSYPYQKLVLSDKCYETLINTNINRIILGANTDKWNIQVPSHTVAAFASLGKTIILKN